MTASDLQPRNIIEVEKGPPQAKWCHGCRELAPTIALKIMGLDPEVEVCQRCVEGWAARFGASK